MRGESGLLSAIDEPGSSNIFSQQREVQPKKHPYFLVFNRALPYDCLQIKKGIDVLIQTESEMVQTRLMSRHFAKKTVSVDSTGYHYPVSCPIRHQASYQVFIPRQV